MAEKGKNDPQLQWIYEGTKSLVNREDYLLGKKVDKNFELYSDAVVREKETGIEAVEKPRPRVNDVTSSSKISNLEVDVVRTEDPLVEIKMKEEKIRQQKMENPLVKLRMQKLLKKAMEKQERKRLKKLKKLEKKKKRHKQTSEVTSDKESKHLTSSKPSSSQSSTVENIKHHRKHVQRDSHIPKHLLPKYSSSSESDSNVNENHADAFDKMEVKKYGLTKVPEKKSGTKQENVNPYKNFQMKRNIEPYKRPEKRKLTEEEMEKKRREMMENADWRDKVRVRNIQKNAQRDEEEDRRNEGKTANFIRPMLNSAASTITVERQLNSHRRGLQSTNCFTEEKFVKR